MQRPHHIKTPDYFTIDARIIIYFVTGFVINISDFMPNKK